VINQFYNRHRAWWLLGYTTTTTPTVLLLLNNNSSSTHVHRCLYEALKCTANTLNVSCRSAATHESLEVRPDPVLTRWKIQSSQIRGAYLAVEAICPQKRTTEVRARKGLMVSDGWKTGEEKREEIYLTANKTYIYLWSLIIFVFIRVR